MVQDLGQLAGEGGGGGVGKLAGRIVDDAGLGGVGDDDLQIVGGGQVHHGLEALGLIGVQAAGHGGDNPAVIHLFPSLAAPQIQGVQAFLLVDHVCQARGDGLNQAALAVPAGLLVGQVEPVIDKGPQEIAFAELHHLFRGALENVALIAGLFQGGIIEFFHIK